MSIRIRVILAISTFVFIAACSTQKHYHLLSIFFDGVPNPSDSSDVAVIDTIDAGIRDSMVQAFELSEPTQWIHQPYLDRDCSSCHNRGKMGSLKNSQPALCYSCHNDRSNGFTYKHGPTAAGFCSECHHPHTANQENLLVLPIKSLCFSCHTSTRIMENKFHKITETTNCIDCHNPHYSNHQLMLHSKSCYMCHEDLAEKYAVLHGPVKSGFCSSCHSLHSVEPGKAMKYSGNDLCIFCHTYNSLNNDDIHVDLEDMRCIECHNPHGGQEKFMIY